MNSKFDGKISHHAFLFFRRRLPETIKSLKAFLFSDDRLVNSFEEEVESLVGNETNISPKDPIN
jgi:hypothetical protein